MFETISMEGEQAHAQQVRAVVDSAIGFFVDNFSYEQAALPLLANSYSLWRQAAHQQLTRLPGHCSHPRTSALHFHLHSECSLLPRFVELVRRQQPQCPERESRQEALMDQYQRMVWVQSLYAELFLDLVRLPYLSHLFSKNTHYRLRHKYDLDQEVGEEEEKADISSKVGQGILKKGVGSLAEKVFTRTVLFKASSLAIRLNPVAMATSYAFSELLEYLKKSQKEEQLVQQLELGISRGKRVVEELQEAYEECLGLLGCALKGGRAQEEQFLKRVRGVVEEDWLQVTTCPGEDGWEIVILQQKESAPETL